jgi:hypothetical protein
MVLLRPWPVKLGGGIRMFVRRFLTSLFQGIRKEVELEKGTEAAGSFSAQIRYQ